MEILPQNLGVGVIWYLVFLFSTTVHEAAHALAALWLGDPTAYRGGQVTLDPIPHIRREPVGMVIVPILTLVLSGFRQMMGWASAPLNPSWADRYPRRAAWVALAGPAANLLLVVLAFALIKAGLLAGFFKIPQEGDFDLGHLVVATPDGLGRAISLTASIFFTLNLLLLLFNLLPLPPLDGSAAIPLFLPRPMARRYLDFMRQPTFSLLGLVVAWKVFDWVFTPIFRWGLYWLYS
ncbi:MAG: hypothetical protein HY717_02675 [Planctomycetes bacterium]|nr:hypothetical protein [Planctomycetota bacterium]